MPVKPLTFKGDKSRPKKRKHRDEHDPSASTAKSTSLVQTQTQTHTHTQSQSQPNPSAADEDDTWVDPDHPSDLSGPVIIVLPTTPPTTLAADAHGNVFASPLENIIDGNPRTAEPHDVRQVWVVNRVAGTAEGEVSFKGAHGGFLSCDAIGVLGARREARGLEEGFGVEIDEDGESARGGWRVRTVAKGDGKQARYLAAVTEESGSKEDGKRRVGISLRGDGDRDSETTRVVLRMQARFKPNLQRDKAQRKSEKISRAELERVVGRRLDEDEVRRLKRAKKDGTYHEEILDVRVKGKHDKFA